MLLQEDGKHLSLNSLHLLIQLLEPCHLAPVPVYFSLQQAITHFHQRRVDINGLMPSSQELMEVVVAIHLDMGVVVPRRRMDLSPLYWPVGLKHPQRIRIGGHMDQNILGRDVSSLIVGDEEGDVARALIDIEEAGDGRHTVL